eukprot:TRINITY_DN7147_c0_g2_i1.p1 TRINITY_DN7147_c0_g2~~TRINITY_DN7147_c0_g2_i1.p1  ORF type:complete len:728 (-),score=119.10 TRINITY_DN7147_c0_g2_i1:437-2620(-)
MAGVPPQPTYASYKHISTGQAYYDENGASAQFQRAPHVAEQQPTWDKSARSLVNYQYQNYTGVPVGGSYKLPPVTVCDDEADCDPEGFVCELIEGDKMLGKASGHLAGLCDRLLGREFTERLGIDGTPRGRLVVRCAILMLVLLVVLVCTVGSQLAYSAQISVQPNPPTWPGSVHIFGPEDSTAVIQQAVKAAFAQNGGHSPGDHGHWSKLRFAFLFKPGSYDVDVPVGYYTTVAGLGEHPQDVVFTSEKGVYSEEGDYNPVIGALNTFWRSAENFWTKATDRGGMLWAVSQAAPLRRAIIENNLMLAQRVGAQNGRASGGFMANTKVGGHVDTGSQQQWLTRNSEVGGWIDEGSWNQVFVGCAGTPEMIPCGQHTSVPAAGRSVEKPFISIDELGKYYLNIPQVRTNTAGASFDKADILRVGFEHVYVAQPGATAADINARLNAGLHVVMTPGIYELDAPLELNMEDQVLLGLGMATLVAKWGNPVIQVGNVDGVRVAGLILEAGPSQSAELLAWGRTFFGWNRHSGSFLNPGVISDVFARVGGPSPNAQADTLMRLRSGNVIIDNTWLWRADHGEGYLTRNLQNPSRHGLVVEGNDVTAYGLFAEHHLGDQVRWYGQNGEVYLLQSELPYDATEEFGRNGYTGLRVDDGVQSFKGYGVGIYHYFRDHPVVVQSGIIAPQALEGSFVNALGRYLSGQGVLKHVLNDKGPPTPSAQAGPRPAYVCAR